ncbi:hypothetical protein BN1708_018243, partial [Verticillium longisporum]
PRAILFTEKGTTSPLLRSIAIDFLDVITIAQARNNQKAVVEKYGIEKFPTLILLPVGASEPMVSHPHSSTKCPARRPASLRCRPFPKTRPSRAAARARGRCPHQHTFRPPRGNDSNSPIACSSPSSPALRA